MVITPHVMAGFVTAVNFERLRLKKPAKYKWPLFVLMCLVSLLSHLLLDRIPHFDYTISELKLFIDCSLVLLILKAIFEFWRTETGIPVGSKVYEQILPGLTEAGSYLAFFAATFFCLVPDLIAVSSKIYYHPALRFISYLHNKNHTKIIPDSLVGLATQLIMVIIFWYVLRKSLRKLYQYKLKQKVLQIEREWPVI